MSEAVHTMLRVAREDADPANRQRALEGLYGQRRDFRDEIAPVLIDALTDPAAGVRAAALNLARHLRPRPDFDLQQLAALITTDPDQFVRLYAIANYRVLAGEAAVTALGAAARDTLLLALEQPGGTYDTDTRHGIAISGLAFFPESVVAERLQAFVKRSNVGELERQNATQVLNLFRRRYDLDVIAGISTALQSESDDERLAAIKSFQAMRPQGADVTALLHLLETGSPTEQTEASLALSQLKALAVTEAITQAIAGGRVPFGTVAQWLASRGDLATMRAIYAGLADAPDAVRQRAEKEMAQVQEYIDRMSRLY
ncbi:MAG: HEAT repeat domain-containing protein [Anaerolineae bacterium]|nr:HEAT repeat domain-containing protein [Anaerolineae bacterium]